MKHISILVLCLMIAAVAWAQAPNFDYGYMMTTETSTYIVEGNVYDAPEFGDWDDDGDQDLMVGVFYNGNVQYYENTSTGAIPEFSDYSLVQADGANIQVTYG
ncbi:hypothetical protein KJ564_11025 [bacterium]|nr:hypothetical protein [bacterium]MBU1880877.1 hypothetical protein [bacterium]